ncbi:MAG: TIGR04002 family protein [Ruminococcus sp.]|nr:TIGR04002 family protein [Ruminococcus sp.]
MKNNSNKIRLLTISALMASICLLLTAYLHIPSSKGYIHIGDGIIFLASSMLPTPYAVCVGIAGAGLADILSGYAIWFPATAVVKGVTALMFSNKGKKIITVRNLLAIIPSFIVCAGGYIVYEALVITDFKTAAVQIMSYVTQITASAVLYILVGITLDKIDFKKKFL